MPYTLIYWATPVDLECNECAPWAQNCLQIYCISEVWYKESPFYSKELQQELGCSLQDWITLFSPRHSAENRADQENIWSGVTGIQNIADTQKLICCQSLGVTSVLQQKCVRREFLVSLAVLIERIFIILTLWSLPSEKLPKECIWNYPANFVLCCQHILFELHAWTCPFLSRTLSNFFFYTCNCAAT